MADTEQTYEASYPTKRVLIGSQTLDIAGVSINDPYFAGVSDGYEAEFERLCDDLLRYDYVCVDVGANIGMKALLAAQYVPHGRVLAIEAAPTIASLLRRNVSGGDFPNITVVETAVGDYDGTVRFRENSAYGHISEDGSEVPIHKLSSLVKAYDLQRLDFLKIDVEGHEFPILKDSMDLLDRHQALVLLEFNSWAMMGAADVHPKEFAKWIFAHFSHVYRVRHGGGDDYLERQSADGALNFLYANLIHDSVVSDLLVTNFERRLTPLPNRLQPALAASIARENEMARARDAALAERDLARAGRDAAEAARDVAIAERDALLRSTSWKVTAPLRALSSAIRPR